MESQGDVKAARLYYQYAKDYLSVVRLLCRSNNIDDVSNTKKFLLLNPN